MRLAEKKTLTLELAKQIATAAENEAAANQWNMTIAILDNGGNLLYLARMDDAQIGGVEVAQLKARTALRFKRPSKAFEDALVGGRMAILGFPDVIPVEGGIPFTVDGAIVGAIGVSGGTSPQDTIVAKAAVDALAALL
jgi:glc operon protein GlcG